MLFDKYYRIYCIYREREREKNRDVSAGGNKATIQSTINAGKANGQPLFVQQAEGQPLIFSEQPQVLPFLCSFFAFSLVPHAHKK